MKGTSAYIYIYICKLLMYLDVLTWFMSWAGKGASGRKEASGGEGDPSRKTPSLNQWIRPTNALNKGARFWLVMDDDCIVHCIYRLLEARWISRWLTWTLFLMEKPSVESKEVRFRTIEGPASTVAH